LLRFLLVILLLVIALLIFFETPTGQNWLGQQVTKKFSRELKTKISFKHVKFSFFNKMELEDFMLQDQQNDTLLFARNIELRITDWFFLKNKAEIKYLDIENAVIKLQKSDTTWNYQFLVNYFTPTSAQPKKNAGIEFNLKKIALKNVLVTQKDPWRGEDMTAFVGGLDMDANEIAFTKKNIDINSLNLSHPLFTLYTYQGKQTPLPEKKDTIVIHPKTLADTLLQWNPGGWTMNIISLNINNGIFKNIKQSQTAAVSYFDPKDLELSSVNGQFNNVRLVKDTFSAGISNLSTKERSGFLVKSLNSAFKINPKAMVFDSLEIRTNNSVVRNYVSLNFNDIADLDDFIHKVRMQADFEDTQIDSDDLAYFSPAFRTWNKNIRITGKVRGSVEDVAGKNLVINVGNSTYINGDLTLTGLPNTDQTFIDFRSNDTRTNYSDLMRFIPSIKNIQQPDIAKLGNIHFKGAFTGFVRDFVTFGTIQTNLGTVTSDLNVKFPKGKELIYSGKLATSNFRLGEFFHNKDIGRVSLSGNFKGHGSDIHTLGMDMDARVSELEYRGYGYRNIVANGKLANELFNGFLSIDDPNVQLTSNGAFSLKGKQSQFNLVADVQKANLKPMGFTKDSIVFDGKFDLAFTGNNIDAFLGTARITNANLYRNGNKLAFDSLVLHSDYANDIRTLTVKSNEFDGSITGDFHIADLPNAVQLFLNKYYPSYVNAPPSVIPHQNFKFNLVTRDVDQLVQVLDPNLKGFNDSKFDGSLDLPTNKLELNAQVPRFGYNQYVFTNTNIHGTGDLMRLNVTGDIQNVNINDTINLPNTTFNITAQNDSSSIALSTSANQAVTRANLKASLITYNDGVKINFDTSSFVLNSKTWAIDKGGSLTFRKNTNATGEVVLRESEQMIRLKSIPSTQGDWNDLWVDLNKVNLGDITPYFFSKPRVEGLISGSGKVINPGANMTATGDFKTDFFRFEGDSIGELNINKITYDNKNDGNLKFYVTNPDPLHSINATGNIYLKGNHTDNLIAIQTKDYQLKILESFIGTIFSQIDGYATGNLDIKGDLKNLNYIGKARLHNAGVKVKFTGVYYKIEDDDIDLGENSIDFGTLRLTDPITGGTAEFLGSILHESWKNMFYDLRAKISGRPITLLNTTATDNSAFYGHAVGTGSMVMVGPQNDMFLGIDAKASEIDSSHISIPPAQSKAGGFADFMVERTHGHSLNDSLVIAATSKITYDIDLTADPHTTITVVLDELTGDSITARGRGSLNIHSGTTEPLQLNGSYFLEEGSYVYSFQSFFKRPFQLRKDQDSYIKWSGDPSKATINFNAEYTAPRVSFAPLASGLNSPAQTAREDVTVIVHMTGELFQPKFDFKLAFPPGSVAISDPILAFNLTQIENNPSEIYKQVTYLIVFNSFAPIGNQGGATATGVSSAFSGAVTELAYGTLSSLMFNELNRLFSNTLAQIFHDDKLRINISGRVYNRNPFDNTSNMLGLPNASNVNIVMSRAWFDDRLVITAGSTLDIPFNNNTTTTTIDQRFQFLPDVEMEYLINPSGSVRIAAFYRENLDMNTTTTTTSSSVHNHKTGASLSVRKEFDNFGELWQSIFHPNRKPKPAMPPPANTIETPKLEEKKTGTDQ
jgi:hypothetical protein